MPSPDKREERIESWKLPIAHIFDPFTGKHLPQCMLADELYLQIQKNLMSMNYKPIISSDGSA